MTVGAGTPTPGVSVLLTADRPATRLGTRLAFLVAGFGVASWAPLVPFVKERLQVDDGVLGLLLLCLGVGSIAAMLLTGVLSARYGSQPIILAGGFRPRRPAAVACRGRIAAVAWVDASRVWRGARFSRCRNEHSRGRGRTRRASAAHVRLPCPLQRRRFRGRDNHDLPPVVENNPASEHRICGRADGDRDGSGSASFAARLACGEDPSHCRAARDRSPARGPGLRHVSRRRGDSSTGAPCSPPGKGS